MAKKVALLVSTLGALRTGSSNGRRMGHCSRRRRARSPSPGSCPAGVGQNAAVHRRDRLGKVIVLLTFKTVRHHLKCWRWSAASRARLSLPTWQTPTPCTLLQTYLTASRLPNYAPRAISSPSFNSPASQRREDALRRLCAFYFY